MLRFLLGLLLGCFDVVGIALGGDDGLKDICLVGESVGAFVGAIVGLGVGTSVGKSVGTFVGALVGLGTCPLIFCVSIFW